MKNLNAFYLKYIKNATTSYIIVGNKKKIDLEALKKLGEIVEVNNRDIFRKSGSSKEFANNNQK